MIVNKAYVKGLVFFLLIGCGAVIALNTVPALKNKVVNTMEDFEHYRKQHNLGDWSLTRRLIAWQLSLELIGRHPFTGVSPADSNDSLSNLYVKYNYDIRENDRVTDPHNQYLLCSIDVGLGGTLILLLLLFFPIVRDGKRINPLLLAFLMVSALCMLFESLLEMQFGVSFFMFFWSLLAVKPLPSD
jgi:O-antigen ligase